MNPLANFVIFALSTFAIIIVLKIIDVLRFKQGDKDNKLGRY